MLIRDAQLVTLSQRSGSATRRADVRIRDQVIESIGSLAPLSGEPVLDARGHALLPGLVDHHIHFLSYAASLASVACGPPAIHGPDELRAALHEAPGDGWLRGYGYHESVAGEIDRDWLDRNGPNRPIRLQHRTGRLWIMNGAALDALHIAPSLTQEQRRALTPHDGRLFDVDALLRQAIKTDLSMASAASRQLAGYGITAFNDMTPGNDAGTWDLFQQMQADNTLLQAVMMSGSADLTGLRSGKKAPGRLVTGATKVHLHEAALPPFDDLGDIIAQSHLAGRPVAIHCVTEAELVFSLAAFEATGTRPGDRIEHASVTPPALVEQLRTLGLTVVTQPGFLFERGDTYIGEIDPDYHPSLYRVRTLSGAGIPLAFSSDAPFGNANPWRAMHTATTRLTANGRVLGEAESVSPAFAVASFLGDLDSPVTTRTSSVGACADICLLDRTWEQATADLSAVEVAATFCAGKIVHQQ